MESSVSDGPDVAVADLAAAQHGILAIAQARAAGLSRRQVEHRIRSGRWVVVHEGVVRIAGAPTSWRARLFAACLAGRAVASHRSAAALWGLDDFPPTVVEVSRRRHRSGRLPGVVCHESLDLERAVIREVDAIPLTDPARTVLDLGSVVPWMVDRAAGEAIRRRLTTWDELRATLERHARRGRAGVGPLRDLLDRRFDGGVGESALEDRLEALLVAHGLPAPVRQMEVRDPMGFIARVDFAYPQARLAIEADGKRYHFDASAFERDRARLNRLNLAGWRVLVFTWEVVRSSPEQLVGQVRRALAA